MKPALSLVFFTVLSGAGLGLAVMTVAFVSELPEGVLKYAVFLSLVLVATGLGASTLHLANPKNAWRAFMRVRTSWLSREAVLAALFFPLLLLYVFVAESAVAGVLRLLVSIIALLTIYCTAMIYQSLKTFKQWHHPNTAFNYLALALMSGGVLFNILAGGAGAGERGSIIVTGLFIVATGLGKWYHYRRIGACRNISVSQATGFSQARARLLDAGHTGPTFLTREFIYEQSATRLKLYRQLVQVLLLLTPSLALFSLIGGYTLMAVLPAAAMIATLLLERWLFFAEAHHSVRAYHGLES